ncbi:hypothetical protein CYMTET_54362 [Cymbomonas tetramitiformis]|uniref:Uncharacterized protein n=1 Tax=Cymbomonas tetramitiformis TaxID=36881 RepID=A0AAE0BGF5_9CHLO|nr:hypothetical protein CYMTET_54362 [Cymbomonas tetramitiformis]
MDKGKISRNQITVDAGGQPISSPDLPEGSVRVPNLFAHDALLHYFFHHMAPWRMEQSSLQGPRPLASWGVNAQEGYFKHIKTELAKTEKSLVAASLELAGNTRSTERTKQRGLMAHHLQAYNAATLPTEHEAIQMGTSGGKYAGKLVADSESVWTRLGGMDPLQLGLASRLTHAMDRYKKMVGKMSGISSYECMLSNSMLQAWMEQNTDVVPDASPHVKALVGKPAGRAILSKIANGQYWFHMKIKGLDDGELQGLKTSMISWADRILACPEGHICIDKNNGSFLPKPVEVPMPLSKVAHMRQKRKAAKSSTAADVHNSQVRALLPPMQPSMVPRGVVKMIIVHFNHRNFTKKFACC